MKPDSRTRQDLIRQIDNLAHWAHECRLALLVQYSYVHKERPISDRDKQVMGYIQEIVKQVKAHQPPEPPPTDQEMEETRKVIVAALDQRENRLRIDALERQITMCSGPCRVPESAGDW